MPELVVDDRAPAPDFASFSLALADPFARSAIGVHISDDDADLLVRRGDWALTFYRQWMGEQIASDRGAPIALPRVVAAPPALMRADAPRPARIEPAPATHPRVLRFAAAAVVVGTIVAAGIVGSGIAQSVASAKPAASATAVDPFPPGLAGPDAPAGSATAVAAPVTSDREDRLGVDLRSALKLDDRTSAAPAVSGIVQKELVHVADLACLQGFDDRLSSQVAQAVSGQPDLDAAAGDAVADAIARYCASAPTN